jgi:hypothetical protein
MLLDIGLLNDFLDITPKAQATKTKRFHITENFYTAKGINRVKRQPMEWKKY